MKCHSIQCPFASPWLCSLPRPPLQFFLAVIGRYLLLSTPLPHLFSSRYSFISHIALSPSSPRLPLSPFPQPTCFALLASARTDIWHKWTHVLCSGPLSDCFTDLVLVHLLKLAQVECVHAAVLNWRSRGDTFWNWPTNAEVVVSPTFSLRYKILPSLISGKKIKLWMTMAPYPAVKSDAYPRSSSYYSLSSEQPWNFPQIHVYCNVGEEFILKYFHKND